MHDEFFELLVMDYNKVKSILHQMTDSENFSKCSELKKQL
jgi:hypothetical protein